MEEDILDWVKPRYSFLNVVTWFPQLNSSMCLIIIGEPKV